MRTAKLEGLIVCVALSACGGGGSPAEPTPTPTPVPVNSFLLNGFSPAAGSTLHMGDSISLSVTFTKASPSMIVGFAAVREDGVGYMTDAESWRSTPPPYVYRSGFGLDPRNGFYDFAKGHVTDIAFLIGDPRMMGPWGALDWTYVDRENGYYLIKTGYTVE